MKLGSEFPRFTLSPGSSAVLAPRSRVFIPPAPFPSLSQAQRLKKFSQEGRLDENVMLAIMTEEKGRPEQLTLPLREVVKRAPKGYPVEKLPELIFRILELYGPQIEAKLQAKKLEKRVQGAR